MTEFDSLADLIQRAKAGIAFTGAGISTESGIPDFRSPGGVWSKQSPVYYDEFLASRDARARYWKMRVQMHREFGAAEPNDGHRALARFEAVGYLVAVITQNIDGLHQAAGSRRVIELHGTALSVECIGCHREWTPAEVLARVEAGDEAPDCEHCGQPLKSKTVSFGQPMPQAEMEEAARLAAACDLCLAIGSSLVVEPAASIPRLAKEYGGTLVIINNAETPLDYAADLIIREPIGETMRAVLEVLDRASS
jgi:NAD-dependent deacetylase